MKNIEKFTLSFGKNFTGGDLSVLGHRFTMGEGPKVYIQGGAHGGEITYPIFRKLYSYLSTNDFCGTVTLVPIANPISWMQRLYFYTAGKFNMYDGKDWNWYFPGKEDGTTAQRYAFMLFQEAKNHELVIDLHTSRWSNPFVIVGKESLLKYAKVSGITETYFDPFDPTKESGRVKVIPLSDGADINGLEGVTIECGSHDSMDEKVMEESFQAVLNMLTLKGVLNRSIPETPSSAFVYSGYRTYTSPVTGFVEYIHKIGVEVKKDDILYKIYPAESMTECIEIKALEDCVVSKYQPTHISLIGDQVVMTIPKDKMSKFD